MDFKTLATKRNSAPKCTAGSMPTPGARLIGSGGGCGATGSRSPARARAWQAIKAASGYAAITWPKAYGGLGGSAIQKVIYEQEEAAYAVPREPFFGIGLGMAMPTLMAYAKPEQLARYVRPALYGEEIWCQLFSEPAGGSDIAGLRTRAVRDGDHWVINGQKVWTRVRT